MINHQDYFIVVAGGKGVRMGSIIPKQFMEVCGKPILMWTLEKIHNILPQSEIILVLPESHIEMWHDLVVRNDFNIPHKMVVGGGTRFQSVKNGLAHVPEVCEGLVGIHDGVRPFLSEDVVKRCWECAEEHGSAIPVVRPIESIRIEKSDGRTQRFDRDKCLLVQTPQTFQIGILKKSYEQPYQPSFTDDASVVEAKGYEIHVVEGTRENIKLTTPYDLLLAEMLLKNRN